MALIYPRYTHLLNVSPSGYYTFTSSANRGLVLFKNAGKSTSGRFVWQAKSNLSNVLFGIFNENFDTNISNSTYPGLNSVATDGSFGYFLSSEAFYQRIGGTGVADTDTASITATSIGVWITFELDLDLETLTVYVGNNGSKTSTLVVSNLNTWYICAAGDVGSVMEFRFDSSAFTDLPTGLVAGWGTISEETSLTYGEYNLADSSQYTLIDPYTVQSIGSSGYDSIRSTISKVTGKWYVEHTITTATTNNWVGFYSPTYSISTSSGNPYNKVIAAFRGVSSVTIAGTAVASGLPALANGDIIGIALDLDTGAITFYRNGAQEYTGAFAINEVMVFAGSYISGDVVHTNFGQEAFTYTVPAGYNSGFYDGVVLDLRLSDQFVVGYEHPNWIKPGGVIPHKTFFPATIEGRLVDGADLDGYQILYTEPYHAVEKYFYWNHFRDVVDGFNIVGSVRLAGAPIEATIKCYEQLTDKYLGMCKGTEYGFNHLSKDYQYYLIAQCREDIDVPAIVINRISEFTVSTSNIFFPNTFINNTYGDIRYINGVGLCTKFNTSIYIYSDRTEVPAEISYSHSTYFEIKYDAFDSALAIWAGTREFVKFSDFSFDTEVARFTIPETWNTSGAGVVDFFNYKGDLLVLREKDSASGNDWILFEGFSNTIKSTDIGLSTSLGKDCYIDGDYFVSGRFKYTLDGTIVDSSYGGYSDSASRSLATDGYHKFIYANGCIFIEPKVSARSYDTNSLNNFITTFQPVYGPGLINVHLLNKPYRNTLVTLLITESNNYEMSGVVSSDGHTIENIFQHRIPLLVSDKTVGSLAGDYGWNISDGQLIGSMDKSLGYNDVVHKAGELSLLSNGSLLSNTIADWNNLKDIAHCGYYYVGILSNNLLVAKAYQNGLWIDIPLPETTANDVSIFMRERTSNAERYWDYYFHFISLNGKISSYQISFDNLSSYDASLLKVRDCFGSLLRIRNAKSVVDTKFDLAVVHTNGHITLVDLPEQSESQIEMIRSTFLEGNSFGEHEYVNSLPVLLEETNSFKLRHGSSAEVYVRASNFTSVEWYYNGTLLGTGYVGERNSYRYTINSAGTYHARIINDSGDILSSNIAVVMAEEYEFHNKACATSSHTAIVNDDGTVTCYGGSAQSGNDGEETNTSTWTNVVSVHTCPYGTFGLRSDGTILTAVGSRYVSVYGAIPAFPSGVKAITGMKWGNGHLAIIKNDGWIETYPTVATGFISSSRYIDYEFSDIGSYNLSGVDSSGIGKSNRTGEEITNVKKVACSPELSVYLRYDNSVVCEWGTLSNFGDTDEIRRGKFDGIKDIASTGERIYFLCTNGELFYEEEGNFNFRHGFSNDGDFGYYSGTNYDFSNIKEIYGGYRTLIFRKNDNSWGIYGYTDDLTNNLGSNVDALNIHYNSERLMLS